MQKRNLLYLSILAAVIFCFSYAQAALQFLPRYQGSYGTRNQEGGRDKIEITCASLGGVEKGTNQTCTGQFIRAGLTCYKSCSCNKSKFQYTIASHRGSGKLCESLSNACTDSAGTSYSNCVLNTCNVRNSTWISEHVPHKTHQEKTEPVMFALVHHPGQREVVRPIRQLVQHVKR